MPFLAFLRSLAGLVGGCLLLAGCSRPEAPTSETITTISPDQKPVIGDWVVQQIPVDPDTLNPLTGEDAYGDMIRTNNIFEGMITMDNYTLKLKPMLAQTWEVSPDQLTYTFHLRHDVKWQDGVPFTAEDVKYTYDTVQDPKVDAAQLRVYFDNIKSCDVLDPYTIRFTATERYFKTLEELGGLPIIPKHILEKDDPDFNKSAFGRNPVGTGPYKFVRWDTGSQIVLERNPSYWGAQNHYPSRLVFRVIQEPYIAAQLLKKGEIDVVNDVAPLQWERELAHSRSASRLKELVYPFPAYSYFGFNLRNPMFADVHVRHAIDLLMPRAEILKQIYLNKYATEATGYILPGTPDDNPSIMPTPYDPKLAIQLLAEAGWKNDHGDGVLYKHGVPFRFTLVYPVANELAQKQAELIQESLRGAGIDLQLSGLEFAQLIANLDDWNFDSAMLSWTLVPDDDPYQLWHSSQATVKKSSNFIGFADPAADKLIEAGRLEYDSDKRAQIYQKLEGIIHDDYPVCFLFNPHFILAVSNRFQDVKLFPPLPCYDVTNWWVPPNLQKYR
jgi:peptide/nickel transport system substrate-binding protein